MTEKNISLYFSQGSSNKVYKASLEQSGSGYVVNVAYGKVGQTLRTGAKTKSPVPLDKAQKIYDSLVKAKTSKGYRSKDAEESEYVSDLDARDTGVRPQLLNPVNKSCVTGLICDGDWWLQEKHDGVRMLVQVLDGKATAINRKGLTVGAPLTILDSFKSVPDGSLIDGEAIGDNFFAFDLLAYDGNSTENHPYFKRFEILETLEFGSHVTVSETAKTTTEKTHLLDICKKNSSEGVVIKNINAKYESGRPASGGMQLKHKFYKTASVIVSGQNDDRRSVQMSVVSQGELTFVGNVTIPPSSDIPEKDSIIEVRYLYAYPNGSLYQPTFLFKRNDVELDECSVDQLEYKKAA